MTRICARHALSGVLTLLLVLAAGCGQEVRSYERDGMTLHHIVLGIANVWVVDSQAGGTLMIDAGAKDDGDDIVAGLEVAGIAKNAVDLVAITHGHLDHAGAGAFLQKELGAPIGVQREDADLVREGNSPVPEGQILEGTLVRPFLDPKFPKFEPDMLFGTDQRLDAFGIPGSLVHLPAHTRGTIAIVLDSGDAFVGDLTRGTDEGARGEHEGNCSTHLFTEDHEGDRAAMETLLARGVTTFFPGHGPFFDSDTVRGWIESTQTTTDARENKSPELEDN